MTRAERRRDAPSGAPLTKPEARALAVVAEALERTRDRTGPADRDVAVVRHDGSRPVTASELAAALDGGRPSGRLRALARALPAAVGRLSSRRRPRLGR